MHYKQRNLRALFRCASYIGINFSKREAYFKYDRTQGEKAYVMFEYFSSGGSFGYNGKTNHYEVELQFFPFQFARFLRVYHWWKRLDKCR